MAKQKFLFKSSDGRTEVRWINDIGSSRYYFDIYQDGKLVFQNAHMAIQFGDGNVVIYHDDKPEWASHTIYESEPIILKPPDTKDEIDPNEIEYLDANIGGWKQSSEITGIELPKEDERDICIYHTMAGKWPTIPADDGTGPIEGNPWAFAFINNKWYGATWEWLRRAQQCKAVSRIDIGFLTKSSPMANWIPQHGETVGFAMATLSRDNRRTSNERTNIKLVVWP